MRKLMIFFTIFGLSFYAYATEDVALDSSANCSTETTFEGEWNGNIGDLKILGHKPEFDVKGEGYLNKQKCEFKLRFYPMKDIRTCYGFVVVDKLNGKECSFANRTYIYSYSKGSICFCNTSKKDSCHCFKRKKANK